MAPATKTKTKNGQVANEAMATAADQVTKEAKAMADIWFDVTTNAVEEAKAALDAQQKMREDGFASWQKYSQSYVDFVYRAAQQTLEDTLARREQWDKVAEGSWKKAEKLQLAEQNAAMEATEKWWNQTQAASERMSKLFTTGWVK